MAEQKPKNTFSPDALLKQAKNAFSRLMQKLFGLTEGWEKRRDILKNNYELGARHLQLGNLNDAILRFKIVTWLDPRHVEGWVGLGSAYAADGKLGQAEKALKMALSLAPGHEGATKVLAAIKNPAPPAG